MTSRTITNEIHKIQNALEVLESKVNTMVEQVALLTIEQHSISEIIRKSGNSVNTIIQILAVCINKKNM